MVLVQLIYWFAGLAVFSFFALLAVTSYRECKRRAVLVSTAFMIGSGLLWVAAYAFLASSELMLLIPPAAVLIFTVLFFAPISKFSSLSVGTATDRVDERDVIFAREEYRPGTDVYERYYSMRPELRATDDKMRKLPELLEPGGRYYDPIRSSYTSTIFDFIRRLGKEVDGDTSASAIEVNPHEMTEIIKDLTIHLGADDVGIAKLNKAYVYSHVGRGPEPWGSPIENDHRFAVVFDVEMSFRMVEQAPNLQITEESAQKYLLGALISITLAGHIRGLGYPARAHIAGSNYQLMLPPVAHDAGLGELGRLGYLISPRFGPRIRLGAVTTDLPLVPDNPISFGVQDFCERCIKCASQCPSGSIPKGDKTHVRGVEKWQLDIESCLHYWRKIGTDCGLCMKVCPFSHPESFAHGLIRKGISRSKIAQRLSIYGEDLVYGKKARP